MRNNIVDRNGIILASTLPTASAYINPTHFINPEESLSMIAREIDVNQKEIREKLRISKNFIWLKRHITPHEQQKLHNLGMPGVYFVKDQKRIYPHKNLFSHIIGLVDIDNNGISGIESSFNKSLQDPNEQAVQISLDSKIQYIVKQELENAITTHSAIGGTAIVMDVHTGELISIVSLPDFDPSNIGNINSKKLFNQATLGVYEMGSVLKPMTLAMALDSGKINIREHFDVSTPLKINHYQINDYRGKGGFLSVPEVLMYSSNRGVVQMIRKVGVKKQKEYLKKLGLLSKISLEIPETSSPIYPSDARWKELSSATISFGHGISMTPVHLVQAFSAIVNKGIFRKATLIKGNNDEIEGRKVFSSNTSALMNKMLRRTAEDGSAKKASFNDYLVGAKTGTAEKIINGRYNKNLNIALCAGAFPINDPKYSILVLIDEPKPNKINFGFATGGQVSAPVISNIVSRIAPILNIAPIDTTDPKIIEALYIDYQPMYKRYADAR
ncbi:peptidoglycan D,D-transpeptidase FtsI family protein [Candidatus Bandiella euplotis]|nr:penicillin-binding protein 2 [Candidatus Bandiella woodruffii]